MTTRHPDPHEDDAPTQATRFVPKNDLPRQPSDGSGTGGQAGPYELQDKISDGGQAVIYKARDRRDGRVVAIKLFKSVGADPEAEQRFRGELEILLSLEHPNIVNELGTVEIEDEWGTMRRGLVMEFLDGVTLKEWVTQHPRGTPWDVARPIMEQCLAGLDSAYAGHGVVHRDIKPSNIFILPDGTVKLIDFGVAHVNSEESKTTGGLLGSFDYMAPDFARGQASFRGDVVSDIFGLFVCFYELLTGRLPFPKFGERPDLDYMARWKGEAPSVSHAHSVFRVMAHLSRFMDRGLALDRERRFPSYGEILEQLSGLKHRVITHGQEAYELIDGLGAGAFGEVFKARRQSDQSLVAIKRLFPDRSGDKFIKEARILAKTQYPGVVRYFDFFQAGADPGASSYFLVMEYLEGMPGSSLRERIKASTAGLPLDEVVPTFLRYTSALGHLHFKGIIHRDIKPANLYALADHPEKACILDLGVARDLSGTKTTGSVPGSWDYMAPELLSENTRGAPRSDLYALGLSLYEAITGGPAFPRLPRDDREAYPELIARANGTSKHTLSFTDSVFEVYPELSVLINRLCSRRLENRPNDARVVYDELLAFGVARLNLEASAWESLAPPALPEVAPPAEPETGSARAARLPEKAPSKSKMPLVMVLVVLLLVAGGGGWWWFNQRERVDVGMNRSAPFAMTAPSRSETPVTVTPPVVSSVVPVEQAGVETELAQQEAAPTQIEETQTPIVTTQPEPPRVPNTTGIPPVDPPPPAVDPEIAELVRQIEILYRVYPVSFGYESFERDIAQRVRSLRGHLQNVSNPAMLRDEKVVTELQRFCAKMTEYALSESVAQNDPRYNAIIREGVYHGMTLEPDGLRGGMQRASALFKEWQSAIPRLPRKLEWPAGPPALLTWLAADSSDGYASFFYKQPEGARLRARLLPPRMEAGLNAEAARGFSARSLKLEFAMVPDASFPKGEPYQAISSPFYLAVIETPVEAMRIYRDDAARMTKEQRLNASGEVDPLKTRGAVDSPYIGTTPQEAMEFCNWLSMRAGLSPAYQRTADGWAVDLNSVGFRLPTVSEWVFAARCGIDFYARPGQMNWQQLRDKMEEDHRIAPATPAPTDVPPADLPRAGTGAASARTASGDFVYYHYKSAPRTSSDSPAYPLGFRDLAGNVAELCMADPPDAARSTIVSPEFVTRGGDAGSKAVVAVMPEFRSGRTDDPAVMIGFRVLLPLPFSRFESIQEPQGVLP